MLLDEGKKAPDFTLLDDEEKEFTLSKALKDCAIVLYFYPKDMTPGCTQESCDFRDTLAMITKKKAKVYGISKDSTESHRKFIEKHQLNFSLLSDPDGKVCETYGVWQEKKMYGKSYMGISRTTYIISKEGIISKVFPKVKVKGHAEEVLSYL